MSVQSPRHTDSKRFIDYIILFLIIIKKKKNYMHLNSQWQIWFLHEAGKKQFNMKKNTFIILFHSIPPHPLTKSSHQFEEVFLPLEEEVTSLKAWRMASACSASAIHSSKTLLRIRVDEPKQVIHKRVKNYPTLLKKPVSVKVFPTDENRNIKLEDTL